MTKFLRSSLLAPLRTPTQLNLKRICRLKWQLLRIMQGREKGESAMAVVEAAGGRRGVAAGERRKAKAKEAAVGAMARALFYPTLLYNVVRSKVQAEFRWWDEVDQFILLGAVPFRRDVPRLQKLGVYGVITLNEPFETLVPSSIYVQLEVSYDTECSSAEIFSLVGLITLLFLQEITCLLPHLWILVELLISYIVKYKNMTPSTAFEHVRSKRARVLLTRSQWRVVQDFSKKNAEAELPTVTSHSAAASSAGNVVSVTEADLESSEVTAANIPDITEHASLSSHKTTPTMPMTNMLSCLFPSLK
uniref:Dual specificity protein phosphatase DSP8 n=1 Tax=Oryza glumipatula TaxID=40148 RepID=A0A0E0A548_9ORYZ